MQLGPSSACEDAAVILEALGALAPPPGGGSNGGEGSSGCGCGSALRTLSLNGGLSFFLGDRAAAALGTSLRRGARIEELVIGHSGHPDARSVFRFAVTTTEARDSSADETSSTSSHLSRQKERVMTVKGCSAAEAGAQKVLPSAPLQAAEPRALMNKRKKALQFSLLSASSILFLLSLSACSTILHSR